MSNFLRSHANVIIALGSGIAVGASVTWIIYRLRSTFSIDADLSRLITRVESLKRDVELLRETLEDRNRGKAADFYSVHASSGDEDDDFQEAFEGNDDNFESRSSLTSDDYVSVKSSNSLSSTSSLRLFHEVDSLLEGDDISKEKAYQLLKAEEGNLRANSGFLWRMAKAAFSLSQIEGARGNENEKKRFIYLSRDFAEESLKQNESDPNGHKWYAIALGSLGDYEGTQTKILNGFKFKEHIEKAIDIAPNDPSSLHLMGRWCYGVYMLSWLERKAAATLFATPPTATVDEALDNFLKADQLEPGQWKENLLFIAKCYIEKRDYSHAVQYLDKANSLPNVSQDDRDSQKEVDALLYKYSGYRNS